MGHQLPQAPQPPGQRREEEEEESLGVEQEGGKPFKPFLSLGLRVFLPLGQEQEVSQQCQLQVSLYPII